MNEEMFVALFGVIFIFVVLAAMFHLYNYTILYNPQYAKPFVSELGVLITYSSSVPGKIKANVSVYIDNLTTLKIGNYDSGPFYKVAYGVCVKHDLAREVARDLIDAISDVAFSRLPGGKAGLIGGFGIAAGKEYIETHLIGEGSNADVALAYSQASFEDEVAERIRGSATIKDNVKTIASILVMSGALIPGYGTILMGIGIAIEASISAVMWIYRSLDWWARCYNDPSYQFIPATRFDFYWNPSMKLCNNTKCTLPFEIYPPNITGGDYIVKKITFTKDDASKAVILHPIVEKRK